MNIHIDTHKVERPCDRWHKSYLDEIHELKQEIQSLRHELDVLCALIRGVLEPQYTKKYTNTYMVNTMPTNGAGGKW